ncbi:hypothetical protein [Marinifilum caeruleilacunae]|uniref:Outer membrane protein beta-barrel domain-containing protein n=1 Tax=Marinifilum caeruleilacunae TaxID=2499076 RepID=A0ABX1WSP1_9BACT|nr:hypothetical protein [Marinifilum caeruleilacunae]NOU59128.1 hypothetical protein [Marinifilum caeruleilacunae]
MISTKTVLLLIFLAIFSIPAKSQENYYQYSKPKSKAKVDLDLITEFEIGFHAGPNWTVGSASKIAQAGHVYSLNFGWNNSKFYGGTEFNLKFWDQILDEDKAADVDFTQKQFLWLVHMKWYITRGEVQPFIGIGTDLLSIVNEIFDYDYDDDDRYHYHNRDYKKDRVLNYNAWFVPTAGVRFKLRKHMFVELSSSFDISDNYNSVRGQVGFIFQPQF